MKLWAKQTGFTIVELLIVIVVIAILAAISIIAYNGIQNRANDSAVQLDLSNVSKKLALYKADNGAYPISTNQLNDVNLKISLDAYYAVAGRANFYYCVDQNSPYQYAIGAVSKSLKGYFLVNGALKENSGVNNIYGAGTCSQIGLTTGDPGVWVPAGWQTSTNAWQDWVM
jgi:prepilin-type N-terminal cleavage/methylation domain-containing protein